MTRSRLALSVLFLFATSAQLVAAQSSGGWKKVPDGFRGVKFGATRQEAEAVLGRLRCTDIPAVKPRKYAPPRQPVRYGTASPGAMPAVAPPKVTPAHTVCTTAEKEKAFTANGKVVGTEYVFDENRFVAVNLRRLETMSPSKVVMYADIRPQFEADYGPPTEDGSTRVKGMKPVTTSTWDVNQNKSVTKTTPSFYDYQSTCAKWNDAKVEIALCAADDLFATGRIETAGWIEKKRVWLAQEPQ